MTALTLTYNNTLSYVTATASSLPSTANVVLFERSTDQIHWTQVRGGSAVSISSNTASVNDYEFDPCVINYYRASAVDVGAPTFVASSAAVSANNAPVSPTLPVGYADGDLLVVWAAIRNSGTGSLVCPSGWTVMLQVDNWALFGARATPTILFPTINITGGATGADVIAQMACFRNLELVPAATAYQKNPSAANITYPGLFAVTSLWTAILYLGWRQSSWVSVATLAGAVEIGDNFSILGSGEGIVWDYLLESTPAAVASGVFTVSGGNPAISYGATVALRRADYVTRTTASITPYMNAVWLKYVESPYLNRSVTLIDWADNQRASRMGTFAVHAQRDSIAFLDIASPRTVTMSLWADTIAERQAIELVLDVGGVVLVHLPPTVAFDSGFFAVGTYSYERPAHKSLRALIKVPMTEVSGPDISLTGSLSSWSTLLNRYATWADEISANATWQAVVNLVGTPADALTSLSISG